MPSDPKIEYPLYIDPTVAYTSWAMISSTFPDQDGTELQDLAAAKTAALTTLGEILRDDPDLFWAHQRFNITCADSEGM